MVDRLEQEFTEDRMIFKNVSGQGIYVEAYNTLTQEVQTGDADNISAEISQDGSIGTSLSDITPLEIGGGIYWFDLTQAETNADVFALISVSSTPGVVLDPIIVITDGGVNVGIDTGVYSKVGNAGTATGFVRGQDTDSLEAVADAVVDEILTGHSISDSLGQVITFINTIVTRINTMLESDGASGYQLTALGLENAPSGSGATAEEVRIELDTNSTKLISILANTSVDIPASIEASKADLTGIATSSEIATLQLDATLIRGMVVGDWAIVDNQMIFKDEANVEIARFNLTKAGVLDSTSPDMRTKV